MRTVLVVVAAMSVAGVCAADPDHPNIYHSLFGQRVVGNEAYVSVSNVWNEMDALPLAEKHCGTFGKVARFNRMEGSRAIFDCITQNTPTMAAVSASSGSAEPPRPMALTGDQRAEAIRFAFGLACAVQDRDTTRANAWASSAMGVIAALRGKSEDAASDFAGVFYSTDGWARANGGYKCDGFPKWPDPPGSSGSR